MFPPHSFLDSFKALPDERRIWRVNPDIDSVAQFEPLGLQVATGAFRPKPKLGGAVVTASAVCLEEHASSSLIC